MRHMAGGWGGRLRRAVVATAVTLLGLLAFSVPALGADPVPKPDPPPKTQPPPPPVAPAQAPQPAAPVAPAPVAVPSVVRPTAAERRAAATRKTARARAAAAKRLEAAHRRERARDVLVAGNDSPSSNWGLPFLITAFTLALLLLGLALTPAWAVPWRRASRALEARRDELGVMGATGFAATLVFFLLVEVTK